MSNFEGFSTEPTSYNNDNEDVGGESNEVACDEWDDTPNDNESGNKPVGTTGTGRGRGGRGRGGGFAGGRGDRRGGGFGFRGTKNRSENDNGDENGGESNGYGTRDEMSSGWGRSRGGERDNEGFNKGDDKDGDSNKPPKELYIPPEPTDNEEEIFSTGIASGINFSKYDNIPVKISGENDTQPISSFEDAGLRDLVLQNVKKSGYKIPTPIQKAALPIIKEGRDVMACAQTGSGKTAAFLLPIINNILEKNIEISIGKPHALIISPTRELAIQIFNEARKFSLGSYIKVGILYGGTSVKHQFENITKGCHILICTPGRLLDFVDKTFICFDDTRFVILDEADRMLDMGFKPDIEKVMTHSTMNQKDNRQTLMFSATFPEEIQRMAGEYLNKYIFITVGVVGGACSDVKQIIYEVERTKKRSKLMEILSQTADGTIVFVEKKRSADFLASLLSEAEYPTTSIHGDRLQSQREMALNQFKTGKMKILIATSVAARGLDIKNVKHVINYDMPTNIEEYVHRIGRTGRVGNSGCATTFFDPASDANLGADLCKILEGADQVVPDFLRNCSSSKSDYNSNDNGFGGRDVRKDVKVDDNYVTAEVSALEDGELWN